MVKKQYRDAVRDLVIAEQRVDSAQEALKEAQKKVKEIDNLLFLKDTSAIDGSELACCGVVIASALQVNGSHVSRFREPNSDHQQS